MWSLRIYGDEEHVDIVKVPEYFMEMRYQSGVLEKLSLPKIVYCDRVK